MRRAIASRAVLALAAIALASCSLPRPRDESLPPAPALVDLDNAATGAQVRVAKGGEVRVTLDSNPSTGFLWQGPPNVAPTLSPIGARAHVPGTSDPNRVGAGGKDLFRYRAEQPGKVTLSYEYRRVWEMIPPARTVKYEVSVEE
ncbi:MAG: protease inhibitor I42 family protein [Burkholderiales bacterium]|nr:protease inhibitor I42 family protein [Burkholderiales bacterium]